MNVSAVQRQNNKPSFGMALTTTKKFVEHNGKELAEEITKFPAYKDLSGELHACGSTTFINGRIGGFLGMGGKKVEADLPIAQTNSQTLKAAIDKAFGLKEIAKA